MISTSGSYDGMMTSSRRVSKPRINLNEGLSLNNITGLISSASGPPKEHMTGALTVDLEFNGEQVKGRYQPNGKMNPGSFTGNVRDGVCTLYDDHDGAPWTGACGRNGFSGSVTSVANNPVQGTVNFQTSVIKIVDYDVRDREAAAVAAADKIASEKRAAAQLAAIRAMPLAGPVLTKQLNSFVIADSAGWVMNHYDAGTIHNVRVAEGSAKTGNMVLRGEYTFNGGESGWVLAKLVGGKLDCIQFWDARIGCRGLRDASYAAAVRGAAISAMSDSGGRGGYKGASDDEIQDGYIERRQNEMNARNNSPQQ
ncbi:MAG TPA: hypothetical protein PK808_06115 [Polymorphobacter sp.]|nr:hypothetical protein [Polymorphobacter sp.]